MNERVENSPTNRFIAFWWAMGLVFCFAILLLLIGGVDKLSGNDGREYDEGRAAARLAKLEAVEEEQAKLLQGAGEAVDGGAGKIRIPVEVAAKVMMTELKAVSPKASGVPVPGSPAAIALMEKQAAEAAAAEAKAKAGAQADEPVKAGPAGPKDGGAAGSPAEGAKTGGEAKAEQTPKPKAQGEGKANEAKAGPAVPKDGGAADLPVEGVKKVGEAKAVPKPKAPAQGE